MRSAKNPITFLIDFVFARIGGRLFASGHIERAGQAYGRRKVAKLLPPAK